jgi:hypothetical protein
MKNFFKCITIFALSLLLHSFGERNKMVVGREYTFRFYLKALLS